MEMEKEENKMEDETVLGEAELVDGIIMKPEKRKTIDKIKQWYYKKVIETGLSQKAENAIDKFAKFEKGYIKVVGIGASIVLLFVQADGPFGEALAIMATPLLCKAVSLKADLERKLLLKLKRGAEKAMGFGTEGQNPDIEDSKITEDEVMENAKTLSELTKKIDFKNPFNEENFEFAEASGKVR